MDIHDIYNKITPRKRITDAIYLLLRQSIILGHFLPHEKIDEHHISQELDVSTGSVRKAFKILEDDKYLAFDKRRGYIVEDITLNDIIQLTEFLHILSMGCVEIININDTANLIILEESTKIGNETTNYQLDKKFHTALALCTYNDDIVKATNDLYDRLFWAINVLPLQDMNHNIHKEHQIIVDHLFNHKKLNMELLDNMMHNHYNSHLQNIQLKKQH